MPIHRAVFSQPGPELNPMGLIVRSPVSIEVLQAGPAPLPNSPWTAREETSKETVEKFGRPKASVFQARYNLAHLFLNQHTPWMVYQTNFELEMDIGAKQNPEPARPGENGGFHFHEDTREPSLCGTRHHQFGHPDLGQGAPLALSLPLLRAGVIGIEQPAMVCPACKSLTDRAPRIGDQVRIKMAGTLAIVIDISAEDGKPKEYLIESIGGQQQQHVRAGEIILALLEKPPFFP